MRRLIVLAVAVAAAAAVATTTPAHSAVARCRVPLQTSFGWEAIFGIRDTRTAAEALRTKATRVGFRNLVVERIGCPKWAVALHGLKSERQGRSLAREARRVGLTVGLACNPVLDLDGDWQAVFGRFAKRTQAEAMRTRATKRGFRGLIILRDICTRRYVLELDGLKSLRQARTFRTEARKAGFAVTIKHH